MLLTSGFLLALAALAAPAASDAELRVGARFPEIVLPTLADGEPGSSRDHRGHKLMLHVWASW